MSDGLQLVELFSSVQGEGPDLGARTLFLRFAGCDLRCAWCDTPHSWTPDRVAWLERRAGSGDFEARPNPLPLAELLAASERLLGELPHRFISLTGGEPLLQPAAVATLAAALGGRGAALLLETHGLHRAALETVLPHLDVVSMDWKFASDVRYADRKTVDSEFSSDARYADNRKDNRQVKQDVDFHDAHEAFLEAAARAARVIVKLVITPRTEHAEVVMACERVARTAPEVCLVLQPVTPFALVRERPTAAQMLAFETLAAARLPDVRVIPQTHTVWNAR